MDRSHAILICPDNDSEARLILEIAEKAKILTVRSLKPHGGKLDVEVDEVKKLLNERIKEVWIVETPGPEKEEELRKMGLKVEIIDHHTYGDFDRLTNPLTGQPNPSSLEQFLNVAQISDEELKNWGFEPKMVKGVGLSDALWVNGLINADYTKEEIKKVYDFSLSLRKKINPEYESVVAEAESAWSKHVEKKGYLIVVSDSMSTDIRIAISHLITAEGLFAKPKVISVWKGDKISVENVAPEIIEKLKKNVKGNTYTFGTGTCLGIDNRNQDKKVTLEEVLKVLGVE